MSTEPDAGLELMSCEMVTGAKVSRPAQPTEPPRGPPVRLYLYENPIKGKAIETKWLPEVGGATLEQGGIANGHQGILRKVPKSITNSAK